MNWSKHANIRDKLKYCPTALFEYIMSRLQQIFLHWYMPPQLTFETGTMADERGRRRECGLFNQVFPSVRCSSSLYSSQMRTYVLLERGDAAGGGLGGARKEKQRWSRCGLETRATTQVRQKNIAQSFAGSVT